MSNVTIKQADCPKTVVIELSEAAARRLQSALESGTALYAGEDAAQQELLDVSIDLDNEGIAADGYFEDGEFKADPADTDEEDGG